jgi:hypothetical protein
MSYVDAFSGALAQMKQGIVVTGDDEFQAIESFIEVDWLPKQEVLRWRKSYL